jgi:hypothetical protein
MELGADGYVTPGSPLDRAPSLIEVWRDWSEEVQAAAGGEAIIADGGDGGDGVAGADDGRARL